MSRLASLEPAVANAYRKLPSPGDRGLELDLEEAKGVLGLPPDTEERAVVAPLPLFVFLLLVGAVTGSEIVYLSALILPGALGAALVLLPRAMFVFKRVLAVQDVIFFVVSFLTAAEYTNPERAYREASEKLKTPEFGLAWSKLVTHEFTGVPDVLLYLGRELRVYEPSIFALMKTLSNELRKTTPNYTKTMDDALATLRTASETRYEVFLSKISLVSVVFAIVPFTTFLMLPVGVAFAGGSANLAFIGAGLFSTVGVGVATLYLATFFPPHLNLLERGPPREVLYAGCEGGVKMVDGRALMALVGGGVLSMFHYVLTLLYGLALVVYFSRKSCVARYMKEVSEELSMLPMFLKDLSFELMRHVPLERALRDIHISARFRSALERGRVAEELPERGFMMAGSVVDSLKYSGAGLGRTLDRLGDYMGGLQRYRELASGKMEDARVNLSFVFWFMPVVVLISLGVFKFLAKLLSEMGGLADIMGLNLAQVFISAGMNFQLAMGAATFFLLICFVITALLTTVCEDIVYPRAVETKLNRVGAGVLMLGAGGAVVSYLV